MSDLRTADRTLPMSVANTGFMLDRLGQDCAPLQFLRELTQNALEACEALADPGGEIVWDVEWNRHTLTDVYKLAIVDTGVGMTGPEMIEYINRLSSSARQQSHEGNFGVGAKVAAATRNHAGLIYLSWKDGKGAMIHLWRDPDSAVYGLRQFEKPDGTFGHWVEVTDDVKPSQIGDHGTMVVLLGNAEEEDTMVAPSAAASPSRWVAYYLNTRYYRFPAGTSIKAREGWGYPRQNSDTNILRTLTGQAAYLEQHCASAGKVELTGASAHWWILNDEPAMSQNSGYIASSGHMAALYQHELYEMVAGRGGTAKLQAFGVIFGHNRVVIYVEPDADNPAAPLTSNTARTHLLIAGSPLPWADWASEFRANMPDAINTLMEQVTAGSESSDHRQAIRERLKQIRDLFKLSRFRPSKGGSKIVDPDSLIAGDSGKRVGRGKGGEGTHRRNGESQAGNVYALFLAQDGVPATEIAGGAHPQVKWVSVGDGTRISPDLDDRAARYLHDQNQLMINGDFRVFTDFIERWTKNYDSAAGASDTVRDTVREWFEQALIETVIGTRALQGSKEWSIGDVKDSLTEEALTAAVMPRYHIELAVKRALGARLGTLKGKSS